MHVWAHIIKNSNLKTKFWSKAIYKNQVQNGTVSNKSVQNLAINLKLFWLIQNFFILSVRETKFIHLKQQ